MQLYAGINDIIETSGLNFRNIFLLKLKAGKG
jgi:hypothetical protein